MRGGEGEGEREGEEERARVIWHSFILLAWEVSWGGSDDSARGPRRRRRTTRRMRRRMGGAATKAHLQPILLADSASEKLAQVEARLTFCLDRGRWHHCRSVDAAEGGRRAGGAAQRGWRAERRPEVGRGGRHSGHGWGRCEVSEGRNIV